MTKWVDYNQIKKHASFKDVLNYYNLKLAAKAGELVGTCPLPGHAGDRNNTNAFHISFGKNCYNCLTHCGGGNIIDFVRLMETLPDTQDGFRSAALLLQENFLTGQPIKQTGENKAKRQDKPGRDKTPDTPDQDEPLVNQPLDFSLEKKLKYTDHWLITEKQFPEELLKKLGIGWCKAGLQAGRIVYPVHNVKGELVAYIGRALTDKDEQQRGKYLVPSNFHEHLELWNFHRVKAKKKLLHDFGLIVVEGFNDALRLIQHGFENVVALMGWSMSDEQEELILSVTDKIVLFLDNDTTGIDGTKKIHKRLIYKAFVKVIKYPEDPDKNQPEHFNKKEFIAILSNKKTTESEVKNE